MATINATSEEALDLSFRALALGKEPPAYEARCPFPGLLAFGARFATSGKPQDDDRRFFFGRDKLVNDLMDRLRDHPLLAVLGGSGSGKSSLVLAGLVPALQKANPGLQMIYMTPGNDPVTRLDTALENSSRQPPSVLQPPAILVVDQFEELFRLTHSDDMRHTFIQRLLELAESQFVVLTMRADFWGDCAPYPALREALTAYQILIAPMTTAELRSAMEQQAAAVGLHFEADLSNTILDEVEGAPGAMPLLQHLLLEMWKRRHGRWLRASEYRTLGGIQQAIAHTADNLYEQLPPADQERMRGIFLRLTTRTDTTGHTDEQHRGSYHAKFSELIPAGEDPKPIRELVQKLAGARLVMTRQAETEQMSEVAVAHEALIRHWPQLHSWLEIAGRALRMLEVVRQAADDWIKNGQEDDYIGHRGSKLKDVESAIASAGLAMNDLESRYLQACRTAGRKDRVREVTNLANTGWGAIFAADADPQIINALNELLARRAYQAKNRYRIFAGEQDGYRRNESTREFLARYGVGSGTVSPDRMPRYLLIVGDPETIPFSFQYQLSTQFAVGRICFQEVEEYAQYAHSVVSAETERVLPRRAVVFAPQPADDTASLVAQRELVEPLLKHILQTDQSWSVEAIVQKDATKEQLSRILSTDTAPALFFSASHGMQFRSGHVQQRAEQGALVCQDWPGPKQWQPVLRDFYFTGDDIPEAADLRGMIAFIFAEFGAGTPSTGDFDFLTGFREQKPESQAPQSFVAHLPQKLLSHLRGGALAVIAHVDKAWTSGFVGELGEAEVIATVLRRLMTGYPVGIAVERFAERYATLTSELAIDLLPALLSGDISLERDYPKDLFNKIIAAYDTRNWVIIGDPAVRLITA